MPVRRADADWQGSLAEGRGRMKFGAFEGAFSFKSRMEEGPGTNPEELLGAAHAGCFSMALAAELGQAGASPRRIHTRAAVHFGKAGEGYEISSIDLFTEAEVPGMVESDFQKAAERAKKGCPVSKALGGTTIALEAKLLPSAPARVAI